MSRPIAIALLLGAAALGGCADSDLQQGHETTEITAPPESTVDVTALQDVDGDSSTDTVKPCCAGEPEEALETHAAWPSESIYQLPSKWRDQDGRSRGLAPDQPAPVVVAMMFTHCEYACPRIISDLKAIEAQVSAAAKDQLQFLLITFDVERDLPDVLKSYASDRELDLDHWSLLHGDPEDVRETAAALSIRYKKTETGGFSHSNLLTLLDRDGVVIHRLEGLGSDPTDLVAAIDQTVTGEK